MKKPRCLAVIVVVRRRRPAIEAELPELQRYLKIRTM